jgi:hypothetical protein
MGKGSEGYRMIGRFGVGEIKWVEEFFKIY